MMGILPTIRRFSDMDLNSGKSLGRNFFYFAQRNKKVDDIIYFGQSVAWLTKENKLIINDRKIDIGRYVVVGYDKDNTIRSKQKVLNANGKFHIVYMATYDSYLILDDEYFNSLFVQMFVLENYDKKLFEPVILDPLTKIYRLKI